MRELHTALDKLKFDSRMTQWNVSNDKLTQQELDAHLASLEDLSSKCVKVDLEDERASAEQNEFQASEPSANPNVNGSGSFNY